MALKVKAVERNLQKYKLSTYLLLHATVLQLKNKSRWWQAA